jgi:hypothetical protein
VHLPTNETVSIAADHAGSRVANSTDRLEEKAPMFDELMNRFEREHLVKLASRQVCQVFVKRFRAFFGGRTLTEITPTDLRL